MSSSSKHLLHFEGGNALSAFRAQALLPRLQAVSARITGVAPGPVHVAGGDAAPDAAAADKLASLLRYGDDYAGPAAGDADSVLVVAMPRLGTVSPWASKATDIAHNCGIGVRRIERVTEYRLSLKAGLLDGFRLGPGRAAATLDTAAWQRVAARLHDRMTESVAPSRDHALHLFDELPAKPLQTVDVLASGRAALETANAELGLALADD